ncbi:MAG TPA: M20 family metallopeptidase [Candidatus Kapabacteria bacterium]|jgi:amidohydrolase|nr:M20 family metallopeptidase [Candidatus Kapabacteria bacterium]HOQ49020.1 M20 family metallopeptidase [Candidatus Kapabacteria bacterium]HPU23280.1 M20 family metallopeptidase [Candidatus Kapabacteria bacterium]
MKPTILEVKNLVEEIYPEVVQFRRKIHQNPELSNKEFATTEFIISILKENNIEYKQITETGVVGIIGNGDNCIALRADIDALPIKEETNLPFASQNQGIMHACGHDLHVAMLLGSAIILKKYENHLRGTIKLIFQPSEELIPGGALKMIKAGVLNNPRPKYILGQHIYPELNTGEIAVAPGPIMAAADELYWNLYGKGSHAAQPHLGSDPLTVAAHLIIHLQTMLNKNKNPFSPAVLSVTSVIGGKATNVFPEFAAMQGTLRTFDEGLRSKLHKLIENNSRQLASLFDVKCDVEVRKGFPALINNPELVDKFKNISAQLLGSDKVHSFEPKMWAEDFAYFAREVPSVFWFLGVKNALDNEVVPLHNSKLNPDEQSMKTGVLTMVNSALELL